MTTLANIQAAARELAAQLFDAKANAAFTQSGTGVAGTVDAKLRGILSVKDAPFNAVGNGSADDAAALVAAISAAQAANKSLFFPAGVYKTTSPITFTGLNNIKLRGEDKFGATIALSGAGDVLRCVNSNFLTVEGLSFQHSSGASGAGLSFTGTSSSNTVRDCFFANNPAEGLNFIGSSGAQQSENKIFECLFLDNAGEQLYLEYSNDSRVERNSVGRTGGGFPLVGIHLNNSDAGHLIGNFGWNNIIALRMDSSNFVRVVGNRFEESRNEGVLVVGGFQLLFVGNMLHTNSQSATGTYAALDIVDAQRITIDGNQMFSWDSVTYKHSHSILLEGTTDKVDIGMNTMGDNLYTNVNKTTATNVMLVDSTAL